MPSTLVPMVTELGPLPSRAEDSAEEMPVCPSPSLDQSSFFVSVVRVPYNTSR